MILTPNNYHSPEAAECWLSASAIKRAHRCEADFFNGAPNEDKSAFIAGHLFELIVTDDTVGLEQFKTEHPEMYSSRGATVGQLKAEYRDVVECAERVKNQPFLMDIIGGAQKQVIMTGTIFGEPIRMMCDLLCHDGSIYDLKSAKNFLRVWSNLAESYVEWWQEWDYPMQLWIYREIARQNGINPPHVGLIGASKSNYDIQAIEFSDDVLTHAKADVAYTIGRIKAIKSGDVPIRCECCQHCIETKIIKEFEIV